MRSITAALRLRATGPAELRRRLRNVRSRIQRTAAAAAAVDRLATTIPTTVFGGGLLSSLSGHLQRALRPPDALSLTPSRPSSLGVLGERAVGRRSIGPTMSRGRSGRQAWDHSAPAPAVARPRPLVAGAMAGPLTDAASPAALLQAAALGGPAAFDQPESPQRQDRTGSMDAWTTTLTGTAASITSLARTDSPLVKRIAEYAELSRVHARRESEPATHAHAGPIGIDGPVPPVETRSPASWPLQEPAATAESLMRFAGFEPLARERVLSSAGERPSERQVSPTARRQHNADYRLDPPSLRDLSDRMADVLRQQARRHGIDLT